MKRLGFLLMFLLVLACRGGTGPSTPVGEYCLSSFNYRLATDVGDTLRTTGGSPYGAPVCMTFEGSNVTIGSYEGAAYVDAVVIYSDSSQASGPLVIWYGGTVTAKVFMEGNKIYLSDASGDLYWVDFPNTEITVDGRTIKTDYYEVGGVQFSVVELRTTWVQR